MPAPGTDNHQLPMSLVVRTPMLTSWLKTTRTRTRTTTSYHKVHIKKMHTVS